MIPRVRFDGDSHARMVSCIFAETLQDLLYKYEDGSGEYPMGYLHTSTVNHEGTCYYGQMWSRDCGRGAIELASLGFVEEATAVCRYFLSHITYGSHWAREIHDPNSSSSSELDGNAMILLALVRTWAANGSPEALGREFLSGLAPVFGWIAGEMDRSPHGGLLPSESELSGNPYTPTYVVYPVFANYAMMAALKSLAVMARRCGDGDQSTRLSAMASRLETALGRLVSDGVYSYAPEGCWINAIDGRDGRAYDQSDWVGSSWPIWHWTRQLPFILDPDGDGAALIPANDVHRVSYGHVLKWMCTGEYFRKYGFVSNSGWSGMAGRHDDTMCGYGQGYFTQAALLMDDVNAYTKCMEGVARLGYDGAVVEPLSFEMNPWIMHECFNYENYERGLDHTFGAMSNGRREVMDNPGDEGNLVQAAEILKAVRLVVGAAAQGRKLVLTPRLPWMWDTLEVLDYPVAVAGQPMAGIDFTMRHERWRRLCVLSYDVPDFFEAVDVRFGPFPHHLPGVDARGLETERAKNSTWIWVRDLKPGKNEYRLEL